MDIEWFRDLSVTILGFAATLGLIIGAIVLLRLYSSVQAVLKEMRMASMIAHDTAARVHEGMRPVFAFLEMVQDMREGVGRGRKRR